MSASLNKDDFRQTPTLVNAIIDNGQIDKWIDISLYFNSLTERTFGSLHISYKSHITSHYISNITHTSKHKTSKFVLLQSGDSLQLL